jgi:MoaA/NifB/PqqE/SkfB family radical SAM enzyme
MIVDDFQLGFRNVHELLEAPRRAFRALRFDSNNDCNVRCVYCHNPRSEDLVELDDFRRALASGVESVDLFQVGCAMEPTLDQRLCDFLEAIAQSHLRPRRVRLQTNGILLHRHDHARMVAAGLNALSVSVDSASAETHRDLRGGTSLARVDGNLREFRRLCPQVPIETLTTVTAANIDELEELVAWGLELGIGRFTFRQMFYFEGSRDVQHDRMPALMVTSRRFLAARDRVQARFGRLAQVVFMDDGQLKQAAENTRNASGSYQDSLRARVR